MQIAIRAKKLKKRKIAKDFRRSNNENTNNSKFNVTNSKRIRKRWNQMEKSTKKPQIILYNKLVIFLF